MVDSHTGCDHSSIETVTGYDTQVSFVHLPSPQHIHTSNTPSRQYVQHVASVPVVLMYVPKISVDIEDH